MIFCILQVHFLEIKFNIKLEKHYSYDDKEYMLKNSIYNLIWKCLYGDYQFSSPDEALNHPFLKINGNSISVNLLYFHYNKKKRSI